MVNQPVKKSFLAKADDKGTQGHDDEQASLPDAPADDSAEDRKAKRQQAHVIVMKFQGGRCPGPSPMLC